MASPWDAAALLVAIVALSVAIFTVWRSDRNASAATLVTLYEALRSAWGRYLQAEAPERREFEVAELANLLELACAVYLDGGVHGAAREMLGEYLNEVLEILGSDREMRKQLSELKERPNTYKYLKRFLTQARLQGKLEPFNEAAESAAAA